ncbi:MAG: MerR family transcriptional regulator, partial [Spirochaetaceae bacterium]|nr:MerR family transcriptional regulator [Spirochaetaceae bacterium]
MRIGEFCERLGIGRETVRHYERLGLLSPARRAGNGYRDFSEGELHRIAFIRRMKAAGFSLGEIEAIDRRTARSGSESRANVVATIDGKIV